ncbi:MAG: tyrosine-type recombinase/integrase [Acidimicrobiales bacterium]
MAGSLRQRSEDSWQLRVHLGRDPESGRKRYVERTFRGSKRQAEKALAALVTEAESLPRRSNSDSTVERLLREWLEHASLSFSPSTVTVTSGYIDNAIVPALGSIPVAKLTATEIDRFYRKLLTVGGPRGPYKPASIRRVHGILRRALSQGVRWGWLKDNPAVRASPPRVPVRELRPPTPDEVARLFRLAESTNPPLAMFIVLAASTGARRGELVALRWPSIDLKNGMLSIERGIVIADNKLIEQSTKTHQNRNVSLDDVTLQLLEFHRERVSGIAAECSTTLVTDAFVLSESPNGSEPMRPDSVTRAFRTLCAKAGVKDVRLHDLRHYVATQLLGQGVDVRTVAGRLGHRNPSTTLNVYAKARELQQVNEEALLA